jgi:hypothetical protein
MREMGTRATNRSSPLRWGIAAGALAASAVAQADVYTWVDAAGRLTVSNLAPPDGVRVTAVERESPEAKARAAAAREAARRAEIDALQQRVAELERAQPAPVAPPPAWVPPPAAVVIPPAPQFNFIIAPSVAPPEPAYASYPCAWVGCPLAFGDFPAVVVVSGSRLRHDRGFRGPRGFPRHPSAPPPMPVRRG